MKVDYMSEIRSLVHAGYSGELLYSYRAGVYEVTLQLGEDSKTFKIPRGLYDPQELKEAVYGHPFK